MSNERTISVKSSVLEKALRDAGLVRFHTDSHVAELRALLDAPAAKNWEYFHNAMESERDYWKALAQKPADQPQGEPVAPFYICAVDFNRLVRDDTAIASVRVSREKRGPFTEPLYAERPAPVAVVLPERLQQVLKFLDGSGELDGFSFGDQRPGHAKFWWRHHLRACIDEVTRLNDKSR